MASPAFGTRNHTAPETIAGVDVEVVRLSSVSGLAMEAICVTRKAAFARFKVVVRACVVARRLATPSSAARASGRSVKRYNNRVSRTFAVVIAAAA